MRISKIQNGHQGASKWPTGSGKWSTPNFLGAPVNFRKISFLIRATFCLPSPFGGRQTSLRPPKSKIRDHFSIVIWPFWHERSALQSVAVRRSTGNDVSGHYFRHYFLLFFFHFFFFSPPSRPFLIEGVLVSKNLFSESCLKWPITLGWTPFQTPSAILGPPGGHFGFCRRCGVAGGERVPPAPLGWYFISFFIFSPSRPFLIEGVL